MRAGETSIKILTINVGSSSIKFALYELNNRLEPSLHGQIERIGLSGTRIVAFDSATTDEKLNAADHQQAAAFLVDWLKRRTEFASIRAIGHRIVHGMSHGEPALLSEELLGDLRAFSPIDPDHLPAELDVVDGFLREHSRLPQVACFDTAFHQTMPAIARLIPIPRRYRERGIARYGFHGLSYAYLMEELVRLGDPGATTGRVILAHLGNGSSLAAVQSGKSIDTSMGFSPTSGVVMSTRSGDLDPGVAAYLARSERLGSQEFYDMANHASGLLSVSETSSDMRDLLAQEEHDVRAKDAVALFCYQVKKWIGAYAAALGGLDTLVFAAGIGENAPPVRQRICAGLEFLGIELDHRRNTNNDSLVSSPTARVRVRVIRTNEELMIARSVIRLVNLGLPEFNA